VRDGNLQWCWALVVATVLCSVPFYRLSLFCSVDFSAPLTREFTPRAWLRTVKQEVANLKRVRLAGASADISSPELRRRAQQKLMQQQLGGSPQAAPGSPRVSSPLRVGSPAAGGPSPARAT
jgi:hypothetical protein